jgi:hypothetical protein
MSSAARLLPIEDDGRVVLLTSRRLAIERELAEVDSDLRKHGVTLDEIVESGRQIRGELVKDTYGLDG